MGFVPTPRCFLEMFQPPSDALPQRSMISIVTGSTLPHTSRAGMAPFALRHYSTSTSLTSRAGPQLSTRRTVRLENATIPAAQVVILLHSPVLTASPEKWRLNEYSFSGSSSHGRQRQVYPSGHVSMFGAETNIQERKLWVTRKEMT